LNNSFYKPQRLTFASVEIRDDSEVIKSETYDTFTSSTDIPTDYQHTLAKEKDFFTKTYGPAKYSATISQFIDKIVVGNMDPIDKGRLIGNSTSRYTNDYDSILENYKASGSDILDRYENSLDSVKTATKGKLDDLHDIVAASVLTKTRPSDLMGEAELTGVPESTTIADAITEGISVSDYWKQLKVINVYFRDYINAMNDYYVNIDWQEADYVKYNKTNPHLSSSDFGPYKEMAATFAANVANGVNAQLLMMVENGTFNKDSLRALETEIEGRYKRMAAIDGNPGQIDYFDLRKIENASDPNLDHLKIIETNSMSQNKEFMEFFYFLNRSKYIEFTQTTALMISNEAEADGSTEEFIKVLEQYRLAQGGHGDTIDSYSKANKYFLARSNFLAQIGVDESWNFMNLVNNSVNGKGIRLLESVSGCQKFKEYVYRAKRRYMNGTYEPKRQHEQLVVSFMRSGKTGRYDMMKSPDDREDLFSSIKNILYWYDQDPKARKRAGRGIRSDNPKRKQSYEDGETRYKLEAMVLLAKESKLVISNYGRTDSDLDQHYSDVRANQSDRLIASMDTKPSGTPFQKGGDNALSANGFNGRDMGMVGLKWAAGFCVFANVMNSFSDLTGNDWFEKLENGVEKTLTNAGVWGSVGAFWAINKVQRMPQLAEYPLASEDRKGELAAQVGLRSITLEMGRSEPLTNVLKRDAEWDAMDKLDPYEVKAMVKKAGRDHKSYPMLYPEDLPNTVPPEWKVGMASGHSAARARFLFYKSFLTTRKKVNTDIQREWCGNYLNIPST